MPSRTPTVQTINTSAMSGTTVRPSITSRSTVHEATVLEESNLPGDAVPESPEGCPTVIFPCNHQTRNLREPYGTFIFKANYNPSDYFYTNYMRYPNKRIPLSRYCVFFDLSCSYSNQHELIADLRLAGSSGEGNIGTVRDRRQGLSVGIEVCGYFYTYGDVHAAANIRLGQLHNMLDRRLVKFVYPLIE
ncbi:hypothetical protein ASPWEDRAFT_166105 [Aspergillus wentii DTO 134E9]|uniref:Uncharacterized protein n=1 Tax=Aspergillus wentii DTO 134E9 TaxID=1073089 RepID=A0A1L9RYX6_ASPWE|nr:uncharacterized protein ASPWEDRAFT_166105 [Aspergillus wentii DTO 134E9]KAI9932450.1 hypothetical protein MW887_008691 [Aspergillus wentii]OJJ40018.1 hypothetical protein ASPWEDRAFT_166105 [Aspergillus wentii DTO 134E9]